MYVFFKQVLLEQNEDLILFIFSLCFQYLGIGWHQTTVVFVNMSKSTHNILGFTLCCDIQLYELPDIHIYTPKTT